MRDKLTNFGITFILLRPSRDILMQLRDSGSGQRIPYPNTWCFPGGTGKANELPIETVIREVREEYNLKVAKNSCHFITLYNHDDIDDHVYLCHVTQHAAPVLNEGQAMDWKRLSEIKNMQLAWEQDRIIPIIERHVKNLSYKAEGLT